MEDFCDRCDALLLSENGYCQLCQNNNEILVNTTKTRVWFNRYKDLLIDSDRNKKNSPQEAGPRVEKFCEKCNKLTIQTYFTAQLRSADEGQTVFYKCMICLVQTFENS